MYRAQPLMVAVLLAIWPNARLAAQTPAPAAPGPTHDFVVAFWYDKTDPAHTMRHQAYDLRKKEIGQDDVNAWAKDVNEHYPLFHATLRSISLVDWQGETEAKKLARAIEWQTNNMVATARARSSSLPALVSPYPFPSRDSQSSRRTTAAPPWSRPPGSGGMSGSPGSSIPPYLLNRPR